MRTIYYLCKIGPFPTGGCKKIYQHVDILNANGFKAFVLHDQDGFRYDQFTNKTAVAYTSRARLDQEDFLVIPEDYGPSSANLLQGIKKVIFNQNAYYSFKGYGLNNDPLIPYLHNDFIGTIVVSKDSREYLNYVFPDHQIFRLHNSINPAIFSFTSQKKKQICFPTRKHPDEIEQVLNIIKFKGLLNGYAVKAINNKTEKEVAEILRESLLYLSFGYPEGCPLSVAEAMACGCLVIGYHGFGGKELMDPRFSFPIDPGDVIAFAKAVEGVIKAVNDLPGYYQEQTRQASTFIAEHYSPEIEEAELLEIWRSIL